MGGRRRLKGGYSVWLPDHSTPEGFMARQYLKAGEEIVGRAPNGSEHLRLEIRKFAISGMAFETAARAHAELVRRREQDKGRRPNLRQIERAARRLGLADMTLREATARLEALAARPGRDLASVVQQAHEDGPAR